MFKPARVRNGNRWVTSKWCHLQADSREELDAMADRIGLRRSWIQYPDIPWKRHYDVTESRRAAAVAAGALEIGMLELARMRSGWRRELEAQQEADLRNSEEEVEQ